MKPGVSWNGSNNTGVRPSQSKQKVVVTGSVELPAWCQDQMDLRHIDSTEIELESSETSEQQRSWSSGGAGAQPPSSNLPKGKVLSSNTLSASAQSNPTSVPRPSLRTQILTGQVGSTSSQQIRRLPSTENRKFQSVSQLLADERDTTSLAELVSEFRGTQRKPTAAVDSVTQGISRIDDRTDERLAQTWKANEEKPVPPTRDILHRLTLQFKQRDLERSYHDHFAKRRDSEVVFVQQQQQRGAEVALLSGGQPTRVVSQKSRRKQEKEEERQKRQHISAPKYSVLVDIFVAAGVYLLISISLFVLFGFCVAWTVYFTLVLLLLGSFLAVLLWHIIKHRKLIYLLTLWTPRQLIGILCIELPLGAILTNLFCSIVQSPVEIATANETSAAVNDDLLFPPVATTTASSSSLLQLLLSAPEDNRRTVSQQLTLCYAVTVLCFAHCNFSQLTNWVKSLLASAIGLGLIILTNVCVLGNCDTYAALSSTMKIDYGNLTSIAVAANLFPLFSGYSPYRFEVILDVLLQLVLIWYLNRNFETIFRISFYGDWQAVHDTEQMEQMKQQADWLLENIIPAHVLDKLKSESRYSENHDSVAVVFASIVNWGEMYEETFEGGREFLRVLNELIADFDDLLDRPEFSQVEKIKTIGPTYMAAAGLNADKRLMSVDPNAHLIQLMEFSLALQEALVSFNNDLLNFEFIMKLGFNIGPVTAGVIGTTKLYYDIWGDTVNIASRMYSTGVKGRIQVPRAVAEFLGDHYDFEFRDHVEVKGIDAGMDVFLLTGRKSRAPLVCLPPPSLGLAVGSPHSAANAKKSSASSGTPGESGRQPLSATLSAPTVHVHRL